MLWALDSCAWLTGEENVFAVMRQAGSALERPTDDAQSDNCSSVAVECSNIGYYLSVGFWHISTIEFNSLQFTESFTMNITQNPTFTQRAASPQTAPKTTSSQALAEQLKAEGEQEVARGEQLQKDGVELQAEGDQQQQIGGHIVDIGKEVKAFGQGQVEEGAAVKAEGQQKIDSGIATESAAREVEKQHTEAFQVGLDAAKSANQNSAQTLEQMQGSITKEAEANAADAKGISDYRGHLTLAGLGVKATEGVVNSATAELANEREAQQQINEATPTYIAGVDGQAAGRAVQMDGRNDVRKADDLQAQSEVAGNRAKAYLDRAIGHIDEANQLGEEVEAHQDQAGSYQTQSAIADVSGDIAKAKSDDQAAVSALLAAKAAIDNQAADGLKGLSHFKEEADRTQKDSALAFTQHLRAGQHSKFYGSLSEGLYEEAGQLTSRSDSELSEVERKNGRIAEHQRMGFGDAGRAVDHYGNSQDLATQSGQVRERGEGKIAEGTAQFDAASAQVESALGIIADANATQAASHDVQKAQIAILQEVNHGLSVSIETRQGILDNLKASNGVQASEQAAQKTGVDALQVDQRLGTASLEQRQGALDGLKTEGANISAAIATQDAGFTQRTDGAATEELGAEVVRGGEAIIEKGESEVAEGEAKAEEGRQQQEAGKVIVDKGQKYQELAKSVGGGDQGGQQQQQAVQQQAAEIPYLVAK